MAATKVSFYGSEARSRKGAYSSNSIAVGMVCQGLDVASINEVSAVFGILSIGTGSS
jgi:hypothetical protein